MVTDLATRTLDRAASALQTARIACLPEIVKLLSTLSGNTDEVSVMELAEVIQNDAIVMSKVIAAANTYYYNPNAVSVTNVIQAIHVIGFERIRTVAMSLMMAEQAARGQTAEEQRAIALQSLTAGCLAQSMAAQRPLLDKDRAFVCACMRSFGHIVMASCMFDDYKQAQQAGNRSEQDEAYRRIFGLTPIELGYQLLRAANLPEEILTTLRALPPDAIAALERRPDEQMLALCECADRLAELACDSKIPVDEFAGRSAELARRFENVLPALGDEMHGLMQSATQQLDYIVRTFRLRNLPPRTLARLRSCRNAVDPERIAATPPAPVAPAPAGTSSSPPTVTATAASPSAASLPPAPSLSSNSVPPIAVDLPPSHTPSVGLAPTLAALELPEHDWQASIKLLAGRLTEAGMTRAKLHDALLATIGAGLGASESLLFVHLPKQSSISLTAGCGRIHERLHRGATPHLHRGDRTVFGVCLQRNENVNIHHAHDPKIHAYLPAWFKGQTELGSFVLFPFTDATHPPEGVLLVGWPEACQIVLPSYHVHAIRSTIAFVNKAQCRLPR